MRIEFVTSTLGSIAFGGFIGNCISGDAGVIFGSILGLISGVALSFYSYKRYDNVK